MGLLSGAEMTTFEMRFIALRCKDTIAPTGTIAQGVGARQVNAHGDIYETKYGLTTSQRVYGTVTYSVVSKKAFFRFQIVFLADSFINSSVGFDDFLF